MTHYYYKLAKQDDIDGSTTRIPKNVGMLYSIGDDDVVMEYA